MELKDAKIYVSAFRECGWDVRLGESAMGPELRCVAPDGGVRYARSYEDAKALMSCGAIARLKQAP